MKTFKKDQLHPIDESLQQIWNNAVKYRCSIYRPGYKLFSVDLTGSLENVIETSKTLIEDGVRTVLIYAVTEDLKSSLIASIDSNKKVKKVELKRKKKLTKKNESVITNK